MKPLIKALNNYLLIFILPCLMLVGCQPNGGKIMKTETNAIQVEDKQYFATIQRTSYGIPHIMANDFASAWFGQGYALAEDRLCILADEVIKLRSQRSLYFGAGEYGENLESDFGYKHLGLLAHAKKNWAHLSSKTKQMLTAHAAGINQYINEKGAERWPRPCTNAQWVTEVQPEDLLAIAYDFNVLLSGRFLISAMSSAVPPGIKPSALSELMKQHLDMESPGSNGWGIGGNLTRSGNGILLAQPHFPWEGDLKSWESHITIPGEMNIYGITIPGIPNVLVGFNHSIAWTLTVTTSPKAMLYQLTLSKDDPTQYYYDGELKQMAADTYSVEVKLDSGKIESQTRTLYRSHYGPMISVPAMMTAGVADYSWNQQYAMTYRDINLNNQTLHDQFLAMSKAESMDAFISAHDQWAGSIPFSNTVAASMEGDVWYADSSPVPNISDTAYQAWQQRKKQDAGIAALHEFHGIYVLDGSQSQNEWLNAQETIREGLVPFSKAPKLRTKDYVFNANGSHWASNLDQLLEGYPALYGEEGETLTLRTRMNALELMDVKRSKDATIDKVKYKALSNRSITALLVVDELVNRCKQVKHVQVDDKSVDLTIACSVLSVWDKKYDLSSAGSVLFREFLSFISGSGHDHGVFTGEHSLFEKPFDKNNPVLTPRGLLKKASNGQDTILNALGRAVLEMNAANIPLDAALGDWQYTTKRDSKIPIHGGNSREGILNIAAFGSNGSLIPGMQRGKVINSTTGLTEQGYPINYGTSFVMAVELTQDGPLCEAITSFSQSNDPDSPWYADQTFLYANKHWRSCLYHQYQILSDPELKTYSVSNKQS